MSMSAMLCVPPRVLFLGIIVDRRVVFSRLLASSLRVCACPGFGVRPVLKIFERGARRPETSIRAASGQAQPQVRGSAARPKRSQKGRALRRLPGPPPRPHAVVMSSGRQGAVTSARPLSLTFRVPSPPSAARSSSADGGRPGAAGARRPTALAAVCCMAATAGGRPAGRSPQRSQRQ
jgi:hypothetical protein